MNNLLGLLFTLAIAGAIVWGIKQPAVKIDADFKGVILVIIYVVALVLCILWFAGLIGHPIHFPT